MSVEEWQKRLVDAFTYDGTVGGRLSHVISLEEKYGLEIIARFRGRGMLIDSFSDFYIETLNRSADANNTGVVPAGYEHYTYWLMLHTASFKRLRAAENVFLHGYPLPAYALLRDLKDRTVLTAGFMNGLTSCRALGGLQGPPRNAISLSNTEYGEIRKRRETEERRVLDCVLRGRSGLDPSVRRWLQKWEKLFHEEVHGSRLTVVTILNCVHRGILPIAPVFEETPAAVYINRCSEVCWLMMRTLPMLQPVTGGFGSEWSRRWCILDESFRQIVTSHSTELGDDFPAAFVTFTDAKFAFSPDWSYRECYPRAQQS